MTWIGRRLLLVASLIEARSCERFKLLAEVARPSSLSRFYEDLYAAEARHHRIFVELAVEIYREQPVMRRLESLSKRHGRRVLLTEAGYRSVERCTERPWETDSGQPDARCRAVALEALFRAFADRPWSAGAWVWKWYPHAAGAPRQPSFSPQGQPAERVLAAEWAAD